MLIRQTGSPVGADKLSELNAVLDMSRAEDCNQTPPTICVPIQVSQIQFWAVS